MSRAAFVRRRGVDGERVDAAFELTDKRFVDHAVALEPALPAERLRHNMHPEMSFPALPMPGVLVGFIHHLEARGGESLGQLFRDEIAPCHAVRNSENQTCRSMGPATGVGSARRSRKEGMAFCPAWTRAGLFELANGRHLPYQKLGVKPPRPYAPRWLSRSLGA
jgi:hypothetical protein